MNRIKHALLALTHSLCQKSLVLIFLRSDEEQQDFMANRAYIQYISGVVENLWTYMQTNKQTNPKPLNKASENREKSVQGFAAVL